MNSMVYGNLALSPQEPNNGFTVVSGGKQSLTVAPQRQFFAPDVYPHAVASSFLLSAKMFAVAIALTLICILGIACGISYARFATQNAVLEETAQMEVKIQPGESLWNLAETHPINGLNTSETVEVIKNWNGLSSSMLHPGESLVVPAIS
ncbi:LysM peptidoglycan-binding domain-containing protein [Collinsella provencensis]|uniref:LysM peptidoglycan-binding domain-containing protein n=1 Tax=Collinsella provencensis TaxID=1937461 RepID=UPI000C83248A|nr:LysM peptidoglycan-binding domain-containing protein [Collinsella provencensis]